MRVFRSLSTYTPGTFEGWLHRITTNLFLDQARRKQRIRFDALGDDAADRLPSALPTPDVAYIDRIFDADVEAALSSLAPDFRAAVVLCDIEGLTYEEIADVLGLKLGTVRSRIHRGRAQLRAALAHRAPAPGAPASPARLAAHARHGRTGAVMLSLSGHIGAKVCALVDGQLSPAEEERAWSHVLHLPRLPPPGRARGLDQATARDALGAQPRVPSERLLGSLLRRGRRAPRGPTSASIERSAAAPPRGRWPSSGAVPWARARSHCSPSREGRRGGSDVPTRPTPADFRGSVPSSTRSATPPTGETNRFPVWTRRSR